MKVKINPLLEQFYLFLEKHNARMAWEANLLVNGTYATRAEFFNKMGNRGNRFITSPFIWDSTPEGHVYWQQLREKWGEQLRSSHN